MKKENVLYQNLHLELEKWTFQLLDLLLELKSEIIQNDDISESKTLGQGLILLEERELILSQLNAITYNSKIEITWIKSARRLLDSYLLDIFKGMKMAKLHRTLKNIFELILDNEKTKRNRTDDIDFCIRNLQEYWVSYNQSYARMVFKLRLK